MKTMSYQILTIALSITLCIRGVASQTMDVMDASMLPFLHFRPGGTLLFEEWNQNSVAIIVAASLGLFLLAVAERFMSALRSRLEFRWSRPPMEIFVTDVDSIEANDAEKAIAKALYSSRDYEWQSDVLRGLVHLFQVILRIVFMLAIMTHQAAYLIAIVVGLGIGEVGAGRLHHVVGALY